MLRRLFLSFLLARAALATPVPGKEISVREPQGTIRDKIDRRDDGLPDVYEPDIEALCKLKELPGAAATGRVCTTHSEFRFHCIAREGYGIEQGGDTCGGNHMCFPVKAEDGPEGAEVALSDYKGNRRIYCLRISETMFATAKKGSYEAETSLTGVPPFPGGTMYGMLELDGDIKGSHPALHWKYKTNERPGINLAGSYVVKGRENLFATTLYPIQYNYEHVAKFAAGVQYLSPRHKKDISLSARLAYFSSTFNKVKRDIPMIPGNSDIAGRDISGNEGIVERDVGGN